MKRITLKEIKNLDLNSLNNVFQDIYRELNRISKSADEITFTNTKDNGKKIVLNDNGKKYVEVTGTARYDKDTVSAQKRGIKQTKKDLAIDNVTNESKETMFTRPSFTGDSGGSNAIINTSVSNLVNLITNDTTEHFYTRLTGPSSAGKDNALQFKRGAANKWVMGYNNSSDTTFRVGIGGDLSTDVLSLTSAGALSVDSTVTSSNGVCSGTGALDVGGNNITTQGVISFGNLYDITEAINVSKFVDEADGIASNDNDTSIPTSAAVKDYTDSHTLAWNSWEFNIFRATGNGTIASARRYYRDADDADDYRRWDAYFTNATGSYVITTDNIAGLFVVPEDCKVGAMYGQIAGDGATSTTNPVIELWKFTPSNGATATPLPVAVVTANVGTSGDESYAFDTSSITFSNNTLSAGDVIIPTLAHSNAGAVQSYYGNLTVKFIKQ